MNFIAAQAVDTSGTLTRTYFELSRLQSMTQWWHWMALLGAVGAIAVYVSLLYRRDTAELPRGTRWLLVLLRLTALAGILIFFFGLEKQTERKLVKPSRVAVLVDTSQSMGRRRPERRTHGERGPVAVTTDHRAFFARTTAG